MNDASAIKNTGRGDLYMRHVGYAHTYPCAMYQLVVGTQEHDGDDLLYIEEFHILMMDLCIRCEGTLLRDEWGVLFAL